jgi:lysophospholipase L1-like esterase
MDRDHEGHNGWRTDQLLPLVAPDMNNYSPNVVMLQAGANDMVQGATVTTAINGVAKLVDAIFAAKPNARIVLFNYVGPVTNTNYPGWNSTSAAKLTDGMKSIASQRAATGKNIRFVDVAVANLSTAPGSLDFGSDGVHPSPQGYKKIADVLFQELTE